MTTLRQRQSLGFALLADGQLIRLCNGTPVIVTDNPNDLSAKFFMQLSSRKNIAAVDGTGTVNPKTAPPSTGC